MRTLAICVALGTLSAAAVAAPGESGEVYIDQTERIERFRYLETLDVTAEKPPAERPEPLSEETEAILEELAELEVSEG